MAKKGPCFKDLWDLAKRRQVCATGREGCSSIHWTLIWGSRPVLATFMDSLTAESQGTWAPGAVRKLYVKHALAPPDTNPHGNPTHLCTVVCVLLLLRKRRRRLQAWNVTHNFRIKTRNHNRVWQGLSDSPMRGKLPYSQTQCIPGSRSRFPSLQRLCVWVRGVTHPPASQSGSLTAASQTLRKELLTGWFGKKSIRYPR